MRGETAVLFDMDGVIFDSERACLSVWQELGVERDLKGIAQVFIRCVGTNKPRTAEILREAFPDLDFASFDAAVRARFQARYGEGRLPVKPGAEEILRALRGLGVPLALASSTERAVVERELGEAGLLRYFDAPSIPASVQRIVPAYADDARTRLYYEFLEFYHLSRTYAFRFTKPGCYRKLVAALGFEQDQVWTEEQRRRIILPDLPAAKEYIIERISFPA